ncbi:glycerophosphoryl diester phosphodiesterase [Neptunitalea chrysea]|uniref:Glycerophosphoryl diester phosphodiesterase n=1 Tax=Neptunitalea chrysea TaxID=1647581 RepID=A0A9W6B6M9_9FLAO|nr:glycerophosphodiester phosphodiesterase family protein [Neptunitalea chrysea]GLB52560.1 glycerophosphoryl diester phosphodiesterase [Neptunitalea chrysea]
MKTTIILALIGLLVMPIQKQPLVIGHRGAMGYETENSLPSIQKALDLHVDAIEIDVFVIKSGELMVFHDDDLERMTGVKGNIEGFTYEELQKLKLTGGYKIPTLQEVMDLIDAKCRFNIELKGANTAGPSYKVVQEYIATKGWTKEHIIFSSFRWEELEKMYALDTTMPLAVLVDGDPLKAMDMAVKVKAEAINPQYSKLTEANVARIHSAGFKIYTWTVNNDEDISYMKTLGVEGIITNYPDREE